MCGIPPSPTLPRKGGGSETLLLSGWTQPVDALKGIAPEGATFDYSDYSSPEASFEALSKNHKHTKCVIAWSMGGQLALRAIIAGALAPQRLVLIAAPYRFVGSDGMDPVTFAQFRANYIENPARTKTRFHGLVAKGDGDFTNVREMLGHHPEVENTARWLQWLDDLAARELTSEQLKNIPPTLIIHGENDHIVPVAQGEWLARHLPEAKLERWADTGHAPHLHDTARARASIRHHCLATQEAA